MSRDYGYHETVPCFWLLFSIFVHYGQCCGLVEIGQEYTMTSTADVPPDADVLWELYSISAGGVAIIYESNDRHRDRNYYPDFFVATKTQLTILNVTKRDATVYTQAVNYRAAYACIPPVYKRASTPTCDTPTLTGNQLRTKCTTAEVYPRANCQFYLRKNWYKRDIKHGENNITYTHTDPERGGNEYYSTSCTLQYLMDGREPGEWTVQVLMYPDLIGVSPEEGTLGQVINVSNLEPPSEPPRISVRSSQHGDTVIEGDDVIVTCDVVDSISSVQSVTLTCGQDQPVTSNKPSVRLFLPFIKLRYDQVNCTCQPTYVTGFFDLMGAHTLTILSNKSHEAGVKTEDKSPFTSAEMVGAMIGVFVGTLVLVTAIALIVFCIRREKSKNKKRDKDTAYDTVEQRPTQPYQNCPADPTYLTANISNQTSSSETTNKTSEHTYNNQGFNNYTEPSEATELEDIEPTEPDLNAYTTIEVN